MMKKLAFIFYILFITSCSSTHISINTSLTSKEVVSEIQKIRDEYSGENEKLDAVDAYANLLLKRNEHIYDAGLAKAWTILRRGYINENDGHKRESIVTSYHIISKTIGLNKMKWEGWYDLTSLYLSARDYKRAQYSYHKFSSFNINQRDPRYLYKKSLLNMRLSNGFKKYKESQAIYKTCSQYASNKYEKINCLHYLALSYPKNPQHVLKVRKHILKLTPNSAWAIGNLGGTYFDLKNYDQAISYYEKAIAVREYGLAKMELSRLYGIKAKTLFEVGKKDKAIGYISKFRGLNYYNDFNTEYVTKVIEKYLGNSELILEILEESEEANENSGKIKSLIAEYYFKKRQYEKARKYFISAISPERINTLKPKFITYIGTRIAFISMWRLDTKEYNTALKWLNVSSKYLEEGDAFASTLYYYLGSSYHEKSWIEKNLKLSRLALKNYELALKYDDIDHDKIHKNIQRVKVNIRNFSKRL